MSISDIDDPKPQGGGKSPTKFMERPGKKKESVEGDPEIGEGNAEFLDQQEKPDSEQDSMLNELGQNPDKKQVRKDAPKKDNSSDCQ